MDGDNRATPTVVDLEVALVELSAGGNDVCGRAVDGSVWCWGNNSVGQLGVESGFGEGSHDNPQGRHPPSPVPGLQGTRQIVAADWSTCVLRENRQVACWGSNSDGQLGDGGTSDRFGYLNIDGLWDLKAIVADGHRACAVTAVDQLECWGHNDYGEIGGEQLGDRVTEPTVAAGIGTVADGAVVAAGNWHTCAASDGAVSCWGRNGHGQLGSGPADDGPHPEPVTLAFSEPTGT